jgi:hypothetical protein
MKTYTTIEVKQSHINRGYSHVDDPNNCIITLAVRAAFRGCGVSCGYDYVTINGVDCGLPFAARKLQSRIFGGPVKAPVKRGDIKPFKFRLPITRKQLENAAL